MNKNLKKLFNKNLVIFLLFILLSALGILYSLNYQSHKSLKLNESERTWIENHPIVKIAHDPNYAPIEFYEDRVFKGVSPDYIEWVEKYSGIEFQEIYYSKWDEMLTAIRHKEIDMLCGILITEDRIEYLAFTDPYISIHNIILVNSKFPNINESELQNIRTGVIKDFAIQEFLEVKYPGIELIEVKDINEGLQLLSFGKIDAFVTEFAQASYYIDKFGYTNIKVLQETKVSSENEIRFAVRKDYEPLKDIINKAIMSMPKSEREEIEKQWLKSEIQPIISEKMIGITIIVVSISLMFVAIILSWNRKLKIINKELENTIKNLTKTQEKLVEAEKLASLANLVAGVAHEINTPVGVSITSISYMKLECDKLFERLDEGNISKQELMAFVDTVIETSEIIEHNLFRATDLISSFKLVAVNQTKSRLDTFNLKDYIKTILLSLKHELKKYKHKVNINGPSDLIITSYPGAISQILTNLLMNTVIHGYELKDEVVIDIAFSTEADKVNLIYTDHGKGILPEDLGNIFEPFYTTNKANGGTGLGLNIVYNMITQKLMGSIDCDSVPNKYTSFSICIPVKMEEESEELHIF
ncbi:MAG: hypothetical protein CVU84_01590 [Firmicutes bacterium HGW-Firmicutes-1]|nr:MAG: hypothetical protein CVU84_01590 [Firmicutes bacterium HGW-Firmicutes-1]